ncbi:hypothetical protein GCM10011380_32640 [Sphingomonas metalli]|uniref:Uncharacterized protein n=1 Tax=Sphingomonas metalli TaxID=1779358 RepID=A0A916WZ11_9SPHN|nr:hypothetical protein [Sphingomonas metalli]GGB40650.1 hypothetical protein GCM10011380_32640 [Sphingomonas metalli]
MRLTAVATGVALSAGLGAFAGLDATRDIPGVYRLGPSFDRPAPPDDGEISMARVLPPQWPENDGLSRDAAM